MGAEIAGGWAKGLLSGKVFCQMGGDSPDDICIQMDMLHALDFPTKSLGFSRTDSQVDLCPFLFAEGGCSPPVTLSSFFPSLPE